VIRELRDNSLPASSPRLGATGWFIAALLAAALIGLVHDPSYATASGAEAIEDGRGLRDKQVMEEGLNAARTGPMIGFLLLMAAGGVAVLTTPRDAQIRWDGLALLIGLGLLWTSAGVVWSVERGTTARELVRLLIYAGVAAALARRFDPRSLCIVLAAALGGSILTAVAFEIATGGFRPWQGDYRLTGTLHSNVLGVQAAVVALIAYAFAVRRDRLAGLWWTIFIAVAAIVFLTKARTALITVMAGAAAVHVIGRPPREWMFAASTAATLLAVAVLGATAFGILDGREADRFSAMGRSDDTTALTGRVPLWKLVWAQTPGYRLQGFGWGAFWTVERTKSAHDALGWYPRHSHNAYLHLVVNVGLVGLALAMAVAIWALARTTRLIERTGLPEYSALAAVLVGIFVNGFAESAFVMPRDMAMFAAVVVFSLVVVRKSWVAGRSNAAFQPRISPASRSLRPFPVNPSLS
jgi:exopolysaccharide production protein ExoQ